MEENQEKSRNFAEERLLWKLSRERVPEKLRIN